MIKDNTINNLIDVYNHISRVIENFLKSLINYNENNQKKNQQNQEKDAKQLKQLVS
ncbi:unnamed protein product [Paramecium sonneborni]|uniref:Uncharacterized protein n=1 Tax=Paramecium sonneborni TaxID=65129 RepID=A0A8S1MC03_9CILI|nr:unnamed protein product [Paramecium sonneborni]